MQQNDLIGRTAYTPTGDKVKIDDVHTMELTTGEDSEWYLTSDGNYYRADRLYLKIKGSQYPLVSIEEYLDMLK